MTSKFSLQMENMFLLLRSELHLAMFTNDRITCTTNHLHRSLCPNINDDLLIVWKMMSELRRYERK